LVHILYLDRNINKLLTRADAVSILTDVKVQIFF